MFGGKKPSMAGAIDVSGVSVLRGARKFARLRTVRDGPMVCIIDPATLGADPALFGLAIVDAARHAAKAYAQAVNISEDRAMARIWEGVDVERANPTGTPVQISGKAN